jgi:hypothetical protein
VVGAGVGTGVGTGVGVGVGDAVGDGVDVELAAADAGGVEDDGEAATRDATEGTIVGDGAAAGVEHAQANAMPAASANRRTCMTVAHQTYDQASRYEAPVPTTRSVVVAGVRLRPAPAPGAVSPMKLPNQQAYEEARSMSTGLLSDRVRLGSVRVRPGSGP